MIDPPLGAVLAIRAARLDDGSALARIYNAAIRERIATFETRFRSRDEMGELVEAHLATHPFLVVERGGEVVGFASAAPYRPRECYQGVAEVSVYVAPETRGIGMGGIAIEALAQACEQRGFWKLVSRILLENAASRGMCARYGFREVGCYRRHARLDGVWRDCVIVERLLGEARDSFAADGD